MKQQVNIRLSKEVYGAIKQLALAQKRSLAAQVELMLEKAMVVPSKPVKKG